VVRHLHSECAGTLDVEINHSPSEEENGEILKL
jgi:hypothetical protein